MDPVGEAPSQAKTGKTRLCSKRILVPILVVATFVCSYLGSAFIHQDYAAPINLYSADCNSQCSCPQRPATTTAAATNNTGPRILCMIFTTAGTWKTKARAVNNTWAKRCNKAVFFYSQGEEKLEGAVALGVPEGRGHLTAKTRMALEWSYYNYIDEIDWFLKADDDVYIIMENLVNRLKQYDPRKPYYVGKNSGPWHHLHHGYCSGGAGYLLSNKAAGVFLDQSQADMVNCPPDGAFEDADIGNCFASMNIFPENTLDKEGRITFHSDHPLKVLEGKDPGYFIKIYGLEFGSPTAQDRMMSPEAISFHYISPPQMYFYDYLLYDLIRN